jgi:shikimate dehydrogenase
VRVQPSLARCVRNASLVVNATPLGLRPDDALPVPPERLKDGTSVLDLVYHPDETELVRRCRAAGLRASDGLLMLIEQGALAFERWFGVSPDRARMWAALDLPADRVRAARRTG